MYQKNQYSSIYVRCLLKFTIFLMLLCVLIAPANAQDKSPINRELKFGTAYTDIGTFDGASFWVGYGASFSESYTPESESYGWVVHFAPEGMYVSLQKGKAIYSGVDVNAGFDFFYGVVHSPSGDSITKKYFSNMSGITFTVGDFSLSAAPMGPLSNLSVGISSGTTFYKNSSTKQIVRAIQYSTGFSTAYALVSIPFPFGVSLGTESSVTAGFYPIAAWDIWDNGEDPIDAIMKGLKEVASRDDDSFVNIQMIEFSNPVHSFLEQFPLQSQVRAFVQGDGNSPVDQLIEEVQQWDDTGETENLPEKLKPQMPPKELYPVMRGLQSATTAAFEAGYKHGYDAKDRTDTIYADCLETVKCTSGQTCSLVVTTDEISALIDGTSPADFEGITVIFDAVPELYLSSQTTEKKIKIEGGKAVYEFVLSSATPILLGVRIAKCPETGNKTVELCRRKVVFD